MKRVLRIFCLLAMAVLLSSAAAASDTTTVYIYSTDSGWYESTTAGTASLELDGEMITTDVDPFILDGHTLVPVRVISEYLGAEVAWDADSQQVTITTSDQTILLTIGSTTALVNGEETELPDGVAATLVQTDSGSRTMVPVRFISEQMGATVDWDNNSRTVIITSEKPSGTVLSITSDGSRVLVETDGPLETATLRLSGRLVIDLPGMLLDADTTGWTGQLDFEGSAVSDLRYSQYDTGYTGYTHVVRLVFDLTDDDAAEEISLYWEGNTLICTLPEASEAAEDSDGADTDREEDTEETEDADGTETEDEEDEENKDAAAGTVGQSSGVLPSDDLPTDEDSGLIAGTEETAEEEETDDDSTSFRWTTQDYDPSQISILLDAGHGGSDPGCQYYDTDEKDLTLSITLQLGSILEDMGYQVLYTRTDDTYVSLTDRTDMANQLGVTIFVSIHVNAYDDEEINGLETYYWTLGTEDEALLAALVHEAVTEATGVNDRGVKTASYWVTRATDMPAILIETGYLSNPEEWANLTSSSYQNTLAEGIAEGIDAFLQQYEAD